MKFYVCKDTGEVLIAADEEQVDLQGREELTANTADAAKEKHVPVVSREGQTVTVEIGEAPHPMSEVHYIQWILLETSNGLERKDLQPGDEPAAQFFVEEDDNVIAAYAYCNLHGLWKK